MTSMVVPHINIEQISCFKFSEVMKYAKVPSEIVTNTPIFEIFKRNVIVA